MVVTPESITASHPWLIPNVSNFPSQIEYQEAIEEINANLQAQIDLYSPLFSEEIYGDCTDLALTLMVAHVAKLADEECLRVQTALKQIEYPINLSLDHILKSCKCDNFLQRTIYGQQIEQLRLESDIGFSMFVIGC